MLDLDPKALTRKHLKAIKEKTGVDLFKKAMSAKTDAEFELDIEVVDAICETIYPDKISEFDAVPYGELVKLATGCVALAFGGDVEKK